MQHRSTALIIAPQDDLHALTVAWEVKQLGGTPLILNLADFPTRWKMSITASNGGAQTFCLRTPEGDYVDGDAIAGVWWRRTQAHKIAAEVTDKEQRAFCAAEARALFEGWIYSLGDRVINPLAADLAARRKPYQLAVAARMGLTIPDTLVTNDGTRLTDFIAPEHGPRVFKTLTPMPNQLTETRALDEAAHGDLHLVELAPVIFQQRIDGGPDIRVTVVDGELFAAEMQADHPEAWLDWRLDPDIDCAPYGLPAAVADNIMSLQRALGLRYGAYDLRRNENGEHVFFEVNPGGQYLFVEISTGHQISRAIARALVG